MQEAGIPLSLSRTHQMVAWTVAVVALIFGAALLYFGGSSRAAIAVMIFAVLNAGLALRMAFPAARIVEDVLYIRGELLGWKRYDRSAIDRIVQERSDTHPLMFMRSGAKVTLPALDRKAVQRAQRWLRDIV